MKQIIGILSLTSLLFLSFSCNKDREMQKEDVREDIQREEVMGADDIRETDTYDRSVPVEEEEVDMERDIVRPGEMDTEDTTR